MKSGYECYDDYSIHYIMFLFMDIMNYIFLRFKAKGYIRFGIYNHNNSYKICHYSVGLY